MQDAVALNIYSDKVLYRIFVSLKIRIIYFQNMLQDSNICERKQAFDPNKRCQVGFYKCSDNDNLKQAGILETIPGVVYNGYQAP